jgi:probable rRNA maturation factor
MLEVMLSEPCQIAVCPAPPGGDESVGGDEPETPLPEPVGEGDPAEQPGLSVTVDLNTPDCDPPMTGWLGDQFARIAALAGVTHGRLTLAIVDDAQMTDLHERYRNEAGTTDVLTFDLREDSTQPNEPIEGDIVICLDEAARQANQRGHDARLEALLYAVHGLMHLLGEDDHDEAGYQKMHRREDELLTLAGLGPVFGLDG